MAEVGREKSAMHVLRTKKGPFNVVLSTLFGC